MPPIRVAFIGASCRAMVQSAVSAGYQGVAADQFADADLLALGDAARLERYPWDAARWLSRQGAAGWMYGGGLENYPRLVGRMARIAPLWGCDAPVLRLVRDPWWLAGQVESLGMRPLVLSQTAPQAESQRWLRKPLRSAGGLGIEPLADGMWGTSKAAHYWQAFAEGVPVSLTFLSTAGQTVLLGSAKQWIGRRYGAPGQFQFAGGIAPWVLPDRPLAQGLDLAVHLARQAGLRGLWGLDAIVQGDSLLPLEINPRPTATVELWERIWGVNWIAAHIRSFHDPESELPAMPSARPFMVAKKILYVQTPGRMTDQALDQVVRRFRTPLSPGAAGEIELADIPPPGTPLEADCPLVTIFAEGPDEAAIENRLAVLEGEVRRTIEGG